MRENSIANYQLIDGRRPDGTVTATSMMVIFELNIKAACTSKSTKKRKFPPLIGVSNVKETFK